MMKKGSYKVDGKFVHDDDVRVRYEGITVWSNWRCCVARLGDGRECRAQLSDHGAGRKSVQLFDSTGLIMDIDTQY